MPPSSKMQQIDYDGTEVDRCTICNGEMKKVVDPKQSHVCYEVCDSCDGTYLDAGELSEFFKGV